MVTASGSLSCVWLIHLGCNMNHGSTLNCYWHQTAAGWLTALMESIKNESWVFCLEKKPWNKKALLHLLCFSKPPLPTNVDRCSQLTKPLWRCEIFKYLRLLCELLLTSCLLNFTEHFLPYNRWYRVMQWPTISVLYLKHFKMLWFLFCDQMCGRRCLHQH